MSNIKKTFYVKGLPMCENIEDYVAIRKIQKGYTVEDHVKENVNAFPKGGGLIEHATNESTIRSLWETVQPITKERILELWGNNKEKLELIESLTK